MLAFRKKCLSILICIPKILDISKKYTILLELPIHYIAYSLEYLEILFFKFDELAFACVTGI